MRVEIQFTHIHIYIDIQPYVFTLCTQYSTLIYGDSNYLSYLEVVCSIALSNAGFVSGHSTIGHGANARETLIQQKRNNFLSSDDQCRPCQPQNS